ncbi:hypothetical protein [Neobacillus sp. Marseille-QA0830]
MSAIDFKLSDRYSPVEEAAFRLVGLGSASLRDMADVLYIFSEPVVAKAVERLVNDQLLSIDLSTGVIDYSPLVEKLFRCCSEEVSILFPEEVEGDQLVLQHPLLISQVLDELDKEDDRLKELKRSITLILRRDSNGSN